MGDNDALTHTELQRMIDEFDTDQDGCINYAEFRRIMKMGDNSA